MSLLATSARFPEWKTVEKPDLGSRLGGAEANARGDPQEEHGHEGLGKLRESCAGEDADFTNPRKILWGDTGIMGDISTGDVGKQWRLAWEMTTETDIFIQTIVYYWMIMIRHGNFG